jgi:hypothetical protein
MDRLIQGSPIRSDGKLTIKSLAEEAGVRRWILTHRHTDLQQEFRDRVATIDGVPKPVRDLLEKQDALTTRADRLAEELRQARRDLEAYSRIINVLTIEGMAKDKRLVELTSLVAGVAPKGESN